MIHLFNKTYLDIDQFIILDNDRIVISETNGYPVLDLLDDLSEGTLFAYGDTVSAVVGPDKKFASILEMLEFCYDHNESTNRKVILYCDKAAFMEIVSTLFKTIFVNIDSTSAYRIIKSAFARHILMGGREVLYLKDQLLESKPEQAEFVSVFDSVTVSASAAQNLLTKVKQKSSVEYLLASYFYNGSFKTELKPVIRLMMTRNAEEHLKEAWRVIQANIMRTSVQQQIGTAVYTIDNVLDMIDDPALQALKKTNAWRAAAGVGSPRELLDLTTFTAEEIATIKEQVVWLKYFILGFDESSPIHQRVRLYIDILHKSGLSDDDLNQVLNFENIASDDDRFWSFKDREHINVYLIEYVLDAKKTSNLEALKPYLLK